MLTILIKEKRKKLLSFLDQKAFDAILRLPPETYSGMDREKFEIIIKNTKEDKRRFHAYKTPEKIKERFLSIAGTDGLKRQNGKNLDYLNHLSTMPDVKKEFIALCEGLDI